MPYQSRGLCSIHADRGRLHHSIAQGSYFFSPNILLFNVTVTGYNPDLYEPVVFGCASAPHVERGLCAVKIGLISDTHDRMDMIRAAVDRMASAHVDMVVHCGDFIAPFTIPPWGDLGVPFVAVFGNNDGEKEGLTNKIRGIQGTVCHPPVVRVINGKNFLICHEPIPEDKVAHHYTGLDYYVFGHTHKPVEKDIQGIKTINPGEACGWLTGKATFALLEPDLDRLEFITL